MLTRNDAMDDLSLLLFRGQLSSVYEHGHSVQPRTVGCFSSTAVLERTGDRVKNVYTLSITVQKMFL